MLNVIFVCPYTQKKKNLPLNIMTLDYGPVRFIIIYVLLLLTNLVYNMYTLLIYLFIMCIMYFRI